MRRSWHGGHEEAGDIGAAASLGEHAENFAGLLPRLAAAYMQCPQGDRSADGRAGSRRLVKTTVAIVSFEWSDYHIIEGPLIVHFSP